MHKFSANKFDYLGKAEKVLERDKLLKLIQEQINNVTSPTSMKYIEFVV